MRAGSSQLENARVRARLVATRDLPDCVCFSGEDQMSPTYNLKILSCVLLGAAVSACGDDDDTMNDGTDRVADDSGTGSNTKPAQADMDAASDHSSPGPVSAGDDTASASTPHDGESPSAADASAPLPDAGSTLCVKYGGADNVSQVVREQVIGAIAGDCRVSTFFTSLEPAAFTRVQECLTIQVQELFGCAGIHYAGAMASNGLPCRDMRTAHLGLAISGGDFDALIEDVVAGLSAAGVEDADISAAAPALLGMKDDIVENADSDPTQAQCALSEADAGMDAGPNDTEQQNSTDGGTHTPDAGTDSSLCAKYGGAMSVANVVQQNVIGSIAADCRVNTFFTSLPPASFTRVQECLTIQVQELFGCPGITYVGSETSNGLPCRSMAEAHMGLEISKGDFDALIEDVVAGLSEAGVVESDIALAAPALLGLEPEIVEREDVADPSQQMCGMSDGGTSP